MPPPALMVMSNKGVGSSVQPYLLLNGTTLDPTPDGSAFSSSQVTPDTLNAASIANLMIEAFGKRFCLHNGVVRERDEGGAGNWGAVYTASPAPSPGLYASQPSCSGLHMVYPLGVPTLVWVSFTNASGFYLHKTTDGISWSGTLVLARGDSVTSYGRSAVFGNSIYWAVNIGNSIRPFWSYDLRLSAVTAWGSPAVGVLPAPVDAGFDIGIYGDFVVHKSKLFFYTDAGSTYSPARGLWRLDGASWTNIGGTLSAGTATYTANKGSAFSDGDDIICLGGNAIVDPQRPLMIRVQSPHATTTPTVTVVDQTTGTPPGHPLAGLTPVLGFAQWYVAQDITDPNSPVTYLWWNGSSIGQNGGTYDCYQYNGWANPMTFLGSGISAASFTLYTALVGASDRIPAKPAARPQFDGLPEEVLGGRKRYFRVYGSGGALTLRLYHNVDQEGPDTLSTLVAGSITVESGSPATTPTNTTTEITNLTPDNGVALYSVIHDTAADGMGEGITHTVILDPI